MMYRELSFFDGFHFAHIAAREEALRLRRKKAEVLRVVERRRTGRGRR